jgi:hypothetical protein
MERARRIFVAAHQIPAGSAAFRAEVAGKNAYISTGESHVLM